MAFTKITSTELNSRGATTLPDAPTIPANQLKEEFDAPAKQVVAPKFNNLIDKLEAESAAASIGMVAPTGRSGATVKAVVDDISSDLATVEENQSTDEGKISDLEEIAHTHSNKSLLDSYDQTNANIKDSINKKHSHSNKSLLDSYTQTEANLADAVSKKHSHSNKSVLDKFTESSGNVLYNAIKLLTNAFSKIKVGNRTVTSSGDDTIEFVQGANMVISADESGKKITFASSGGASGGTWGAISGDIDDQQDLQDALDTKYLRSEANVLGAKNLLKPKPLAGTSSTGISYRVDENGCWLNGTASSTFAVEYGTVTLPAGKYIYTDDVETSNSTYFINVIPNPSTGSSNLNLNNKPYSFTLASETTLAFTVYVKSGQSVSNIQFKPMIHLASDPDNGFQPFAKTNQQLTTDKAENSSIAPIENGSTASQAYAIGKTFMRNGELCIASAAISSGGTLTKNTNYKVIPLGGALSYNDASVKMPTDNVRQMITLPEGYTSSSATTTWLFKKGSKVCVSLALYKSDGTAISSMTQICTLSSGYRPPSTLYFQGMGYDGLNNSAVKVENSGISVKSEDKGVYIYFEYETFN